MKYYESKFSKFVGSAGFYTIIACCLIGIGAASWFAVSRYNSAQKQIDSNSSKNSSAYSSQQSAYNNNGKNSSTPSSSSKDVQNEVSNQPYSSEEKNLIADSFVPPVTGEICKGYNDKELQFSATYNDMRLHLGIDIACEQGSDIVSCGNGKVKSVEENTEYGTVITIDHGNSIVAKYCGINEASVKADDAVKIGEKIGTCGTVTCECADQSHIHIEVTKDGKSISPFKALGIE